MTQTPETKLGENFTEEEATKDWPPFYDVQEEFKEEAGPHLEALMRWCADRGVPCVVGICLSRSEEPGDNIGATMTGGHVIIKDRYVPSLSRASQALRREEEAASQEALADMIKDLLA